MPGRSGAPRKNQTGDPADNTPPTRTTTNDGHGGPGFPESRTALRGANDDERGSNRAQDAQRIDHGHYLVGTRYLEQFESILAQPSRTPRKPGEGEGEDEKAGIGCRRLTTPGVVTVWPGKRAAGALMQEGLPNRNPKPRELLGTVCRPLDRGGRIRKTTQMLELRIEPASVDDIQKVADVHVRAWQWAYRGLMPDGYLDSLSVDRRGLAWEVLLHDETIPAPNLAYRGTGAVGLVHAHTSRDADASATTGEVTSIYLFPEYVG